MNFLFVHKLNYFLLHIQEDICVLDPTQTNDLIMCQSGDQTHPSNIIKIKIILHLPTNKSSKNGKFNYF